jgi:hypothetical protein
VSSLLFGGVLVFCSFDTLASKIASFFVGLGFLACLWYGLGALTKLLTLIPLGTLETSF